MLFLPLLYNVSMSVTEAGRGKIEVNVAFAAESASASASELNKTESTTPVPQKDSQPSTIPSSAASLNASTPGQIKAGPGGHPHITELSTEDLNGICARETAKVTQADAVNHAKTFEALKEKNFVSEDGKINFRKILEATGTQNISKLLTAAKLEGTAVINKDGELDVNISGRCGPEAVELMTIVKAKFNAVGEANGLKNVIVVNPQNLNPSEEDLALLERGGQIRYQALPNGNTAKIILDPGNNGKNDGLMVEVYEGNNELKTSPLRTTSKIPLSVVFEGEAYKGQKALKNGHHILPNWRKDELFKESEVQQETIRMVPLMARFDQKHSNLTDLGRIQAENNLWDAVYTYLGLKLPDGKEETGPETGGERMPFEILSSSTADATAEQPYSIDSQTQTATQQVEINQLEQPQQAPRSHHWPNLQALDASASDIASQFQTDTERTTLKQASLEEWMQRAQAVLMSFQKKLPSNADNLLEACRDLNNAITQLLASPKPISAEDTRQLKDLRTIFTSEVNKGHPEFSEELLEAFKRVVGTVDQLLESKLVIKAAMKTFQKPETRKIDDLVEAGRKVSESINDLAESVRKASKSDAEPTIAPGYRVLHDVSNPPGSNG